MALEVPQGYTSRTDIIFTAGPAFHWLRGAAFLLLALGGPAAWLLGIFAGLGSVLLWKASQASSGEGRKG